MIWVLIILVFYVLPVWYAWDFIKKSYGPGGFHEGEAFEDWLLVCNFLPVINLLFAIICVFQTPYKNGEKLWTKIIKFIYKIT
jgi:hypothetical protein